MITGLIERRSPIELAAAQFLKAHTTRRTKVTVPGPFTLSQLADNKYYPDQRELALAYAAAVNAELRDLAAAGIDMLQIDEPYLQANPEAAREFIGGGRVVGSLTALRPAERAGDAARSDRRAGASQRARAPLPREPAQRQPRRVLPQQRHAG